MSWDAYVNQQLVGSGHVSQAAICGLDGSIWSKSVDWNITPEEVKKITDGISGDPQTTFSMSGVKLAGQKYFFLGATDDTVRCKLGANGIHMCKTNKAVLIGKYDDPIQPGQCANQVESLAEYLRNASY